MAPRTNFVYSAKLDNEYFLYISSFNFDHWFLFVKIFTFECNKCSKILFIQSVLILNFFDIEILNIIYSCFMVRPKVFANKKKQTLIIVEPIHSSYAWNLKM